MLIKISKGMRWVLSLAARDVPDPNPLRSNAYVNPLYGWICCPFAGSIVGGEVALGLFI